MSLFKQWLFTTLVILFVFAPFDRVVGLTDEPPIPQPTPEATTVLIVPDEQPVEVPDAPPSTDIPDGSVLLPAWQLFAFIFSALLGGGALGVAGVGVVAKSIMNNPAALKNAEAVGNSVPQNTANRLIELADSAMSVAALAKEMLDRVPAETKPLPTEAKTDKVVG